MIGYDKCQKALKHLELQFENYRTLDDGQPEFIREAVGESVIQRSETCYPGMWKLLKCYLIEEIGLSDAPNGTNPLARLVNENYLLKCGAGTRVYASRIKGNASPRSDLDIVVFATPGQSMQVSNLRESFEESDPPFRVDLFVWDEVLRQCKKNIEAEHSVLVGNPFEEKMGAENCDCCR